MIAIEGMMSINKGGLMEASRALNEDDVPAPRLIDTNSKHEIIVAPNLFRLCGVALLSTWRCHASLRLLAGTKNLAALQ